GNYFNNSISDFQVCSCHNQQINDLRIENSRNLCSSSLKNLSSNDIVETLRVGNHVTPVMLDEDNCNMLSPSTKAIELIALKKVALKSITESMVFGSV